MEKGLFPGQGVPAGEVLAPGAPSWEVESHFSSCCIWGLPLGLPRLQQVLGCSPSLCSLGLSIPVAHMARNAGSGWGYRIVRVLFPGVCS